MKLTAGVLLAAVATVTIAATCGAAEDASRWVHPLGKPLDATSNGPFVELANTRS